LFKRSFNIVRIHKSKKEEIQDTVLIEKPIDIFVNSEPLVNIICLPKDLKELALGFLFSIGIVNSIKDIKEFQVNDVENRINIDLDDAVEFNLQDLDISPISRVVDTTCGIPSPWRKQIKKSLDNAKKSSKVENDIKVHSNLILNSIKQMQLETPLYRETGGCHGAAIFNFKGELIGCKEDIGRHNAIDKVIGEMLLTDQNFEDKFLTSTGRLTGDCVLKAVRAKIPIVASLSAAIESGIRLAFSYGITLIGFVRGSRMNIYTNPHRIEI
jgi:FdhD protein